MPYTVQPDPGTGITTLTYSGAITTEDLLGATAECIALQKSAGCLRYLIEAPGSMIEASTVEIFNLPTREYPQADLDRRTRMAIVEPQDGKAREAARFFESACRNRGWNARVIRDRAAAIAWLGQAPS